MKKAPILILTMAAALLASASIAARAGDQPQTQTEQTPWGVHTETVSGDSDDVYQQAASACLAALPAGTDTGPHSTALQTCITDTVAGVGDLDTHAQQQD